MGKLYSLQAKKITAAKAMSTSCRFAFGELPSVGSAQIASSALAHKGINEG